jgi:hypothetical protein
MRILSSALVGVLLVASFSGCGTDKRQSVPPPADAGPDAGDAGPTDAGDAGPTDAGDAGPADAGDAGPTDAGDAGPADAGDAGTVLFDDAGCPLPQGAVLDPADAGIPAAGLTLWLRTDVGLAVKDGGDVCRWEDVSGHGNHFLPATSTPARYDATGLNGHPAVSIQGPSQYLSRGDLLGLPATAGRTIALIGQTRDTVHRYHPFLQGQAGSAGTYFGLDMNTFQTAGSKEGVYVTNNGYDADLVTGTDVRTHVFSIESFAPGGQLPAVLVYSVNGVTLALTRTPGGLGNGTVEDFSNANFTVIADGDSNFAGAELGDVLVYDRPLTSEERIAVEAYLRARFP